EHASTSDLYGGGERAPQVSAAPKQTSKPGHSWVAVRGLEQWSDGSLTQTIAVALDKQGVQLHLTCQVCAFTAAFHHQHGCPGIGSHAGLGNDSDRSR